LDLNPDGGSSVLAPRRYDLIFPPRFNLARASKRDCRRRFQASRCGAARRPRGKARASVNVGVLSRATGGQWLDSGPSGYRCCRPVACQNVARVEQGFLIRTCVMAPFSCP
jgi:hypothetical protein